jgi:hypothetical protein
MMHEPMSSFSPETVKEIVVVLVDVFGVIVMFVICWLVMFPLIVRLTFAPLWVGALIVDFWDSGFKVGLGLGIGVGVGVGAGSAAKVAAMVMALLTFWAR